MRNQRNDLRGIEVQHEPTCPGRSGGRCRCEARYRARVFDKATNKRVSGAWTSDVSQAKADRTRLEGERLDGTLITGSTITVRALAEDLLAKMESGEVRNRSRKVFKPSAIRSYDDSLRIHVLPMLGAMKVGDLKRKDLQTLVDKMEAKHAPSTIRNAINPVRTLFRYAIRCDLVKVDPTKGLELPAVEGQRDRIASPSEAKALITALPDSERALWATAFYAGLRRGELQGLRWDDVDFEAGTISVARSYDQIEGDVDPKSKAGKRVVPIIPLLKVHLLEQKMRTRGDLVFPGERSDHFIPNTVAKRAKKAWKAAKLASIGLHEARHTFVSLLIAADVNVKAVSVYAGHGSVAFTLDRYGHLLPSDLDSNAAKLSRFLEAANA